MAAAVKKQVRQLCRFLTSAQIAGAPSLGSSTATGSRSPSCTVFPTAPTKVLGHLHWDVLRLFAEMKTALGLYVKQYGKELAGIGVDTWGVDFALLDAQGNLLSNPYHYRDIRTEGMYQEAFKRVPREEIFARTGIQFMEINTLYQLLSMALAKSPLLDAADKLLMMPDLLNYWLTGRKVCEFTEATTTQFYDPREKGWSRALFQKLGLPERILAEIVPPGTVLGPLHVSVAEEVGLGNVPVIAPACHDTGSAVAAVPAVGRNFAYISSGTWSLLGTEVKEPVITPQSLAYNFTNEGGVCGTFRFLKNIMGLWLVQESRRAWTRAGKTFTYDELDTLALRERPFLALIDPDDPLFLRPGTCRRASASIASAPANPCPKARARWCVARWKASRSSIAGASTAWKTRWAAASNRSISSVAGRATSS